MKENQVFLQNKSRPYDIRRLGLIIEEYGVFLEKKTGSSYGRQLGLLVEKD